MKKEIKKLTRQEKEHIENKLLVNFAIALGAVMVLMYLINWFNGSLGFRTAAKTVVYIGIVAFIALSVFFKIKSGKAKKENQEFKAKKYNNWFIFSIIAAVVSFLTYPNDIFNLILPQDAYNVFMVNFWERWRWFGQDFTASRLILFMILIGIYTLALFIYYGVYLARAHKSSLNKGGKKKK